MYSANTAPITATATAIFAPLSAAGSAAGASTMRSVCQREASSVRMSLSSSGSTLRRASSVVTTTGKKQTITTIASLAKTLKPNQKTSSGARITNGTACEETSSG